MLCVVVFLKRCSLFLLDPDTKELVATVFDSGPSEILQVRETEKLPSVCTIVLSYVA